MKRTTRTLLVLLTASTVAGYGDAQHLPDAIVKLRPLRGYARSIAGEKLDYNCFNLLATTALVTRCTSGDMDIEVSPGDVVVTYVKSINNGTGHLVRLFNAGGSPEVATLKFAGTGTTISLSSPMEEKGELVRDVRLPANGIGTLRVE